MSKKSKNKVVMENDILDDYSFLRMVAFWGFAILLFFPPFFRGLFFASEQRIALICAILVFAVVLLWKWLRKESTFLSHPLDYLVLAVPLVYIASVFKAVNYGFAIDEVVKTILYFLVYLVAVQLIRNKKDAIALISVIYVSALWVALAGLLTATGLLEINDGFLGDRIASYLQYPNALAAYLVFVLTAGIYLWWNNSTFADEDDSNKNGGTYKQYIGYLLAIGNYIMACVIWGTKSNGGLIAFAIALLILFVLLKGRNRLAYFFHITVVLISSAAAEHFFYKYALTHKPAIAWLFIAIGAIAVFIINLLLEKRLSQRVSPKIITWMVIGVVSLSALGGLFSLLDNDMPDRLLAALKPNSIMDRAYFIGDAVKMFRERPILGWGGGGWSEAYQFYQSYSYLSRQVHSYFVQIGVETGIIGLVIIVGIWGRVLFSFIRALMKSHNNDSSFLITAVGVSILALGIHSSIDFDLSISAIALVLYVFLALLRNFETNFGEIQKKERKKGSNTPFILASTISVILLFFAGILVTAEGYTKDAMNYLARKEFDKSIIAMEKAQAYDPFRAEYNDKLMQVYYRKNDIENAIAQELKAVDKSKYNAQRMITVSQLEALKENYKGAVEYAEKVIDLAPWYIGGYEYYGTACNMAASAELKNGNPSVAKEYFKKAAVIPQMIDTKNKSIENSYKQKISVNFRHTGKINLNTGIACLFLGESEGARAFLETARTDESVMGDALLWLSVVQEKLADNIGARASLDAAVKLSPKNGEKFRDYKGLYEYWEANGSLK